jgi:hypothetical protein
MIDFVDWLVIFGWVHKLRELPFAVGLFGRLE